MKITVGRDARCAGYVLAFLFQMAVLSCGAGDAHADAVAGWRIAYRHQYQEALAEFEKSIAADARDVSAWHGKSWVLTQMMQNRGGEGKALRAEMLKACAKMLEILPVHRYRQDPLLVMNFAPETRALRMQLRYAYNCLAWYGMEDARSDRDLEAALANSNMALNYVFSSIDDADLNSTDTKVRILMKLRRNEEAFALVAAHEQAADFRDIVSSDAYSTWKRRSK